MSRRPAGLVTSATMRRTGPEEEACGVWLDAAALKRRKVQVGRWGMRGGWGQGRAWRRKAGGVRREEFGGHPEVLEAKSGTEGTALGIHRQEGLGSEEG